MEYSSQSYCLNHSGLKDLAFPAKKVAGNVASTGCTGAHDDEPAISSMIAKAVDAESLAPTEPD